MKKKRVSIDLRALSGFILIVVFSAVFAVWFDFRLGLTFSIGTLLALLLSGAQTGVSMHGLLVGVSAAPTLAAKGNTVQLTLTVKSAAPLPLGRLTVKLKTDARFSMPPVTTIVFPLWRNMDETYTVNYQAQRWGTAELGIEEMFVSDLLGFLRFPVRSGGEPVHTAEILPAVPDIEEQDLLWEALSGTAADDREDETFAPAVRGGFPGYDFRLYEPGDPFKRIHWKLSARQDRYMVRLDEPLRGVCPLLVIDPCHMGPSAGAETERVLREEQTVEAALGVLAQLARCGASCDLYVRIDGQWRTYPVAARGDISSVQYALSRYRFVSGSSERLPVEAGGSLLYFTPFPDRFLLGCTHTLRERGARVQIITSCPAVTDADDLWLCDAGYAIRRL